MATRGPKLSLKPSFPVEPRPFPEILQCLDTYNVNIFPVILDVDFTSNGEKFKESKPPHKPKVPSKPKIRPKPKVPLKPKVPSKPKMPSKSSPPNELEELDDLLKLLEGGMHLPYTNSNASKLLLIEP